MCVPPNAASCADKWVLSCMVADSAWRFDIQFLQPLQANIAVFDDAIGRACVRLGRATRSPIRVTGVFSVGASAKRCYTFSRLALAANIAFR